MTEVSALLVDVGNSRTKWATMVAGRLCPGAAICSDVTRLSQTLTTIWGPLPAPSAVVISNVAGDEVRAVLARWVSDRWRVSARFIESQAQGFGVVNGYEAPERLGVDRWAALVGARNRCTGPVCIADCGTALTFDALDGDGRHLGGLIAPGLDLMRGVLAEKTHGLLRGDTDWSGTLARNTAAAMVAGVRLAAVGLIEAAIRDTARQVAVKPRLLLTGGDADVIASRLNLSYELIPNLVLEGLSVIAESTA